MIMALLAICARAQGAEETTSQKIDDNASRRIDDEENRSQKIDDDNRSQRMDDDHQSQPIDANSNAEPLFKADGSESPTEEGNDKPDMSAEEIKKKLEEFQMMQHFFCFIGVKKYINDNQKEITPIVEPNGQKAAQKLLSATFEACLEDTMKEETMQMMIGIKSREQLANLQFPFFKSFPLEKFGADANFELTDDDKQNLKIFEKVQKQFDKMYKKKNDKKAKTDDDDDDDVQEDLSSAAKKKQKQKPTSSLLNYAVLLLVIGLLVVLAKAAIKATSNDSKPMSNKEKKAKEGKGQKVKSQ